MLGDRDAWEYRLEFFEAYRFGRRPASLGGGEPGPPHPTDELNALGAKGWELVSASFEDVEGRRRWVCVLKRRRDA